MMRRIIMLVVVALVMAAMMLAMALPAFAAGGAAENCGPPGQTHSDYAKDPGESTPESFGGPPGAVGVTQFCAPGQLKDDPEPI
jgi:hypothetical protein